MFHRLYVLYRKHVWPIIKIPLSYILITIGYIFDFIICLPFLLMMMLNNLFQKNS